MSSSHPRAWPGSSWLGSSSVWRQIRLPYQPPLLLWTLAFTVGVALEHIDAPGWTIAVAAVCAVLAACSSALSLSALPLSALSLSANRFRTLNLILILCAPLLIAVGIWRADHATLGPDSIASAQLTGQPLRLTGVIANEPVYRGDGMRFLLDTEQLQLGAELAATDDLVQVHVPEAHQLAYGDRLQLDAVLTTTAVASDEYLEWLLNQGIAAFARAEPGSVTRLGDGDRSWLQSTAASIRRSLNQSLGSALATPFAGLAQGIITGRYSAIDRELRSNLDDTSLSHLIVISGSNLTLLSTIVLSAGAWLLGRRVGAVLAIAAVLAYGAMVGPDPPVQRAMWMAVVFATAHLLGRGASALDACVATAGLLIAIDPPILLNLSFQLTVAGTLGIVLIMPTLSADFLSGQHGIIGAVREVALVTLVATLATLPLIVLHFERAALIGVVTNLLVGPWFSWMLLGSALTAIIGLFSETLASIIAWPAAWLPLRWLVVVAEQGVRWPGAGLVVDGFNHLHLMLIYAAILLASLRPHRERVRRWFRQPVVNPADRPRLLLSRRFTDPLLPMLLTSGATALAATLWLSACSSPDDRLAVHFIDVGQGDSALIVTPDQHSILIDTGERPDDLLPALRRFLPGGTREIDLVVITHPQADHAEALWAISERYGVRQLLVNSYVERTALGRRLIGFANQQQIPLRVASAGQRVDLPGQTDLKLDVLWPPTHGLPSSYLSDANATSLVIRARYGSARFLFSGDINAEQELDLARLPCAQADNPCDLRADVLKVAHQGSKYSSTTTFLRAVQPTIAVVSAGAGNPYGHPHPEALDSIAQAGSGLLSTIEHGDITVYTDGRTLSVTTEHSSETRYR